jgi:hypothetical protein
MSKKVEKSSTLTILKPSSCVVVYATGDYEYFRNEAMARKKGVVCPVHWFRNIVFFHRSMKQLNSWKVLIKKKDQQQPSQNL